MSDLISRQALCEYALNQKDKSITPNDIMRFPSAQPERKVGKWVNGACSQCGSHAPYWAMASTYYRSNFCPNCGADMRGEKEK